MGEPGFVKRGGGVREAWATVGGDVGKGDGGVKTEAGVVGESGAEGGVQEGRWWAWWLQAASVAWGAAILTAIWQLPTLLWRVSWLPIVLLTSATDRAVAAVRAVALRAARLGPVPQHVAFIMDGNRRFADMWGITHAAGHRGGYANMIQVLRWCLELGVRHVTVYAFSMDNFSRTRDEVNALMRLFVEKIRDFEGDPLLNQYRIRYRTVGVLDALPPEARSSAARAMESTASHRDGTLNMCVAYTSRHELGAVARDVAGALRRGELAPSDVTPGLVGACLDTHPSPPVDLLVRTSGEQRLSDFLTLQANTAHLHFTDVLWPDMGLLDLVKAVADYQVAMMWKRRGLRGGEGVRGRGVAGAANGAGADAGASMGVRELLGGAGALWWDEGAQEAVRRGADEAGVCEGSEGGGGGGDGDGPSAAGREPASSVASAEGTAGGEAPGGTTSGVRRRGGGGAVQAEIERGTTSGAVPIVAGSHGAAPLTSRQAQFLQSWERARVAKMQGFKSECRVVGTECFTFDGNEKPS